jgi:hypothetical protein
MTLAINREKSADEWRDDIDRSVTEYNDWYMREAPIMWVEARHRAVAEAAGAMEALDDFRDLSVETLTTNPRVLLIIRMAFSPRMARDRFVKFVGVKKSLVESMELRGTLPKRVKEVETSLQRICDFAAPLCDPELFPWLADDREPTMDERKDALLVLGDRRAGAAYDAKLRNAQEARQKALMGGWLESHGLTRTKLPAFEMSPGTFRFGQDVPIPLGGDPARKLPVDCVVAPAKRGMPLACVEMKSAGDFTNVNKRRKEEAEKHDALAGAYGENVVFLLQLFGYFDFNYLNFEARAGIDWAWDHRLADLAPYFGI